ELRVAEAGERARAAKEQEGKDERGTGADADHFAVGPDLAGRGGADRAEDAGANHRADRQHDQIAGAEGPLEPLLAFRVLDQRRNRLSLKQLIHRARGFYSEVTAAGGFQRESYARSAARGRNARRRAAT